MVRVSAGLPSPIMNGGMSCTTFEQPPIMDNFPMRQNWCTAASPPITAWSSTVTCPRQRRHVGHDDVVAQRDVVRDVAVGQDVIVRADARDFAVAGGAVDGDVFAKGVVVADFGAGDAAFPLQVLRLQSDAGERENFISFPELRVAVNDDVRMKFAAVAQHDVLADNAIWPDLAIRHRFAPWDG